MTKNCHTGQVMPKSNENDLEWIHFQSQNAKSKKNGSF